MGQAIQNSSKFKQYIKNKALLPENKYLQPNEFGDKILTELANE